ncbi:MAG: glycosyltransferase [Cetobacterium sp.]
MYLEKHLKTIELMEYELRHKLKEYDLNLSDGFKDEKEWYAKSQNVKMVFGNNIVIDYQEGTYIVFKEKNLNFNSTEGRIKVNELDEYNLVFEGKNLDKGNIKVFIVEYNRKKEKLKINSYSLNTKKNLKFEKDTRFVRIAFRTEGTGTSIISNFDFYMKKKSKKISQPVINDFKEISNEFDKNFINNIQDYLKKIPSSNGSKYYKSLDINVAIIADEFLFNSYKGIANFIYITPENYKDKLNTADCFFIASTWRGLNNEWNGLCYEKNDTIRKELYKIIEYAKSKGIKTIFYSKEDPVNYNVFIETAKKCDYIYTTAEEKIKDYIADCGHNRVEVLEFGINPLYHNPIGLRNFSFDKKVLFSGSWYEKYSERCNETINIFNGVLEGGFDLKIIDRNFNINYTTAYKFPEKYNKYISPGVKHDQLQKLHKLYNWAINLNTIKDSNTMFANRVYELQAMGNILISNYSIGVNNKFPNVFLIQNGTELKPILNTFTDYEIYLHQMYGVRNCMTNHSNNEKLEKVFEIAGININRKEKKVLILCDKISSQIKESFIRQTYNNKELKSIKDFTEKDYKNSDIIAYFSEKYFYEEFYIESMLNCFKFTDCDYITKDIYYKNLELDNGIHNNYINYIKDCNRTLYWKESFGYKDFLNKCLVGSIPRGYSSDPLEILDSKENKKINLEKKLEISVIIPTYNNGNHLLNKCFNSLRRSSIFNEMEIIIVDDGSTDKYTPNIVRRIARKYSNVKTFFYGDS